MNPTQVEELKNLLRDSLFHITVRTSRNETMALGDYRAYLLAARYRYNPELRLQVSLYKPDVEDQIIKEKLLNLIETELAPFIQEGRIHTATAPLFGGVGAGASIESMLTNLLIRTVADGPEVAAAAFAECAGNTSCTFYDFELLAGARVNEEIEVFDGIRLIPMPSRVQELPPYLPLVIGGVPGGLRPENFLSKTVLRVEMNVTPVLARPSEKNVFDWGPDAHFQITPPSNGLADFQPHTFCQALSLTSRRNIRPAVWWKTLNPYEIFDLSSVPGGGGLSWSHRDIHETTAQPLDEYAVEEAKRTYSALVDLPQKTKDALRVPIDRWTKSTGQIDPADRMIDLGIALESIYLSDTDYRNELRFRLALRAAWHLGTDQADRARLIKEFRDIYDWRSRAVHTGNLDSKGNQVASDPKNRDEFISRAQELCSESIMAIIRKGQMPDWNGLILGED